MDKLVDTEGLKQNKHICFIRKYEEKQLKKGRFEFINFVTLMCLIVYKNLIIFKSENDKILQMMFKITLSILTILALFQPFIFFYILTHYPIFCLFLILGFLSTMSLLYINYKQKSVNGSFNFIWSLLILLIGFGTLSIPTQWVCIADAMIFMTEREAIVKKIKADKNLNQQLDYTHNSILPVALKNQVIINEIETDKFTIKFETNENGFFKRYSKGVLYTDKPEKINFYEKEHTDGAGVIFESSFRIKKIRPNWYIYEFEDELISD